MLKIANLHFDYNEKTIFSGFNLTAKQGHITAIMGPSGCGKSTLLRLIGGLLQSDQGSIYLDDTDLTQCKPAQWRAIRRKMGFLFQNTALFSSLTVFENVAFPLRQHTQLPEALIHDIVLFKLQGVGLRGAAHLLPEQLSGGMARRVALARAIALDPTFMMYDEPLTGLDPIALGVILRLITDLNKILGITTLLVSHQVPEVCKIADYVYLLGQNTLLAHGTPLQLQQNPDPNIQQFIQGSAEGPVAFHYPAEDYTAELLNNTSC